MSEKTFRKQTIEGYKKSPELLSKVIARALVWNVGKEDHLLCVNQMITDIDIITGDVIKVCDDFARIILDYATGSSKNN